MKKRLLIIALVATMILSLASCGQKVVKNPYNLNLEKNVEISEENNSSYFSDALVDEDGGKVEYVCIITLNPTDGAEHTVKLFADCSADCSADLIKEESVYGTFEGSEKILVPAAGLAYAKVIFTFNLPDGYKEGDETKLDRSLPEIYIVNAE